MEATGNTVVVWDGDKGRLAREPLASLSFRDNYGL